MASTRVPSEGQERAAPAARAQAPIRWPRPDRLTLGMVGLWLAGLVVALFLPALVVAPGAKTADAGPVIGAFSLTVLGALIMVGSSYGIFRRHKDPFVFVMGGVPAVACVAGGIMLAATKLVG